MSRMVQFHIQVPFDIKMDGDWYISCCEPLDVFSQGSTEEEAIKNLTEAVQLFVSSCYERGTLESVLKESGFEPERHLSITEEITEDRLMNVPLPLLIARNAENHAH